MRPKSAEVTLVWGPPKTTLLNALNNSVRKSRPIRSVKAMRFSIRDLAERAMVSKSSIVSLEHGKSCRPSTLAKVCSAMSLHVERFTSPLNQTERSLSRLHTTTDEQWFALDGLVSGQLKVNNPKGREQLHREGVTTQLMMFNNVPSGAGFIAGIIELSDKTEPRSHSGREFIYVLLGRAIITIDDQNYTVSTGEAITILDFERHSYGPAPGEDGPVSLLCFRVS